MSESTGRRSFLASVATGWTLFTAASVAGLGMCVRFLFPNDTFEPATKFKVGQPEEFAASAEGSVDKRFKTRGVWIVRRLDGFFVLSTVCTHLGCTPNWLETERKFKCPCHGSGFYSSGINFEGPAPRPLERFKVSLAPDGQLEIDKSKKFQQEKGQWEDADAFLAMEYTA
ncbi:MAG: ubiquinol-cytochrome c reductase iron-sulfur subunit [Planctomycetota bacterium]|mgnify:FL=1